MPVLTAVFSLSSCARPLLLSAVMILTCTGGLRADIKIEKPWQLVTLDRISVDAASANLGGRWEDIHAYVRDNMRFDPYLGVLRGARGVLTAQGGNSVDQALLLHDLLKAAGHISRLVRSRISVEDAQQLIESVFASDGRPVVLEPEMQAELDALEDRIMTHYELVSQALGNSGLQVPELDRDRAGSMIEATRDHWWVQVRVGDSWIDLDPTWQGAPHSGRETQFFDSASDLPADLHHIVKLSIVAELKEGEAITTETLLSFQETAAALSGHSLFLAHRPVDWSGPTDLTAIGAAIGAAWDSASGEGSNRLVPVLLSGDQPVRGKAYVRYDPEAAAPAKPSIFSLGTMIEGKPATNPASALWVDIEFVTPDGDTTTVRRPLFDRVAPALRHAGTITPSDAALGADDPINSIFAFSFHTGPIEHTAAFSVPDAAARDETIENAENLAVIRVNGLLASINHTMVAIADGLASPVPVDGGSATFSPETPRLTISGLHVTDDNMILSLDLRHAAFTPLSNSSDADAFFLRVFKGVLDGVVEDALWTILAGGGTADQSVFRNAASTTVNVFREAMRQEIGFAAYQPGSAVVMPEGYSADVRARIQSALTSGMIVLAPNGPVDIGGRQHLAWWTIDPASGRTKAVMESGLNGTIAEYIIVKDKQDKEVVAIYMKAAGETTFRRLTSDQMKKVTMDKISRWIANGQIRRVVRPP